MASSSVRDTSDLPASPPAAQEDPPTPSSPTDDQLLECCKRAEAQILKLRIATDEALIQIGNALDSQVVSGSSSWRTLLHVQQLANDAVRDACK